jgi:hypothetical protein
LRIKKCIDFVLQNSKLSYELKACPIAFIQTFASLRDSQCGLKKYCNPFSAPSSVNERPSKITIKTKGKLAVKYRIFVEDFIDFQMAKSIEKPQIRIKFHDSNKINLQIQIQAVIKHATRSHLIPPGDSIPNDIFKTLFLRRIIK